MHYVVSGTCRQTHPVALANFMTTPHAQWLTLFFLAAVTALVVGYDLLIIRAAGPDASISRVLGWLLVRWPLTAVALLFWLGLLIGHVWLPAE
jgi:hypothetical protein